jgi:hypothetical protein
MLAVSGFLPHCGLPVDGIRGFIAATVQRMRYHCLDNVPTKV